MEDQLPHIEVAAVVVVEDHAAAAEIADDHVHVPAPGHEAATGIANALTVVVAVVHDPTVKVPEESPILAANLLTDKKIVVLNPEIERLQTKLEI